jgi:hypothetical protein
MLDQMNLMDIVAIPWVLPVVCGSIVAIVAILGGVISDCIRSIARTNLKRSMVEQGYTIEQIDHVLKAR